MKTIKLNQSIEYLGRIRQAGEVLVVGDNFSQGKTLTKDTNVKNIASLRGFKIGEVKKEVEIVQIKQNGLSTKI